MNNYTLFGHYRRGPVLKRVDLHDISLSPLAYREYCGSSYELYKWSDEDGDNYVLKLNSSTVLEGSTKDINEFFESGATWYAVMRSPEDNWDTGSYDLREARRMRDESNGYYTLIQAIVLCNHEVIDDDVY